MHLALTSSVTGPARCGPRRRTGGRVPAAAAGRGVGDAGRMPGAGESGTREDWARGLAAGGWAAEVGHAGGPGHAELAHGRTAARGPAGAWPAPRSGASAHRTGSPVVQQVGAGGAGRDRAAARLARPGPLSRWPRPAPSTRRAEMIMARPGPHDSSMAIPAGLVARPRRLRDRGGCRWKQRRAGHAAYSSPVHKVLGGHGDVCTWAAGACPAAAANIAGLARIDPAVPSARSAEMMIARPVRMVPPRQIPGWASPLSGTCQPARRFYVMLGLFPDLSALLCISGSLYLVLDIG